MGVFVKAVKDVVGWPAPGWAPSPGRMDATSSIVVNSDTAMTVGAFHAGVRLIAEDIASLPLVVFQRTETRGAIKAETHPSYRMLHDEANPEMTAMVWRETMLGHYLTWGNCYSEKELNGLGQTVRLWPLRPDRMTVERDKTTGTRIYKYRMPDGSTSVLPSSRILHVPGFGFDGLIGYSRITMARRSLESAIALEEYGLHTFANGAAPGVVITHPESLSKSAKKNLKDSWEEQHQGLSNAQRTAILDEGMAIEQVGFAPEDAQFLEAKRHSTEEVARWLRLAPHKLSDLSRATFSNIEESNLDHVIGTLTPPMVRFEQQLNKDVLAAPFYVKHNAAALLRGNSKDRADYFIAMRLNGLMTDDEIRALEDLNALTPADRAKLLLPLNSVPASAYDETGMTSSQRAVTVGALVRAGYDPDAALVAYNLPQIRHTGFLPATVQTEPLPGKDDPEREEKDQPWLELAEAIEKNTEAVRAMGSRPIEVDARTTIEAGAVQVDVKAADVHVPPMPPVHVEVKAPEPAAPTPPTRKSVQRDDAGRITAIVEEPA